MKLSHISSLQSREESETGWPDCVVLVQSPDVIIPEPRSGIYGRVPRDTTGALNSAPKTSVNAGRLLASGLLPVRLGFSAAIQDKEKGHHPGQPLLVDSDPPDAATNNQQLLRKAVACSRASARPSEQGWAFRSLEMTARPFLAFGRQPDPVLTDKADGAKDHGWRYKPGLQLPSNATLFAGDPYFESVIAPDPPIGFTGRLGREDKSMAAIQVKSGKSGEMGT
jgi:hypothetical protein